MRTRIHSTALICVDLNQIKLIFKHHTLPPRWQFFSYLLFFMPNNSNKRWPLSILQFFNFILTAVTTFIAARQLIHYKWFELKNTKWIWIVWEYLISSFCGLQLNINSNYTAHSRECQRRRTFSSCYNCTNINGNNEFHVIVFTNWEI